MRDKSKTLPHLLAALLVCLPAGGGEASSTITETYGKVHQSDSYGTVNFARGPQPQRLGYSADLKSKIIELTLELPNGALRLPDRFETISFRHYTIEGRSASWIKALLFRGTGLTSRNVSIVFPEATQKRLTSLSVAEISNQVYRTKSRLIQKPTTGSPRTRSQPLLAVTSSVFSANFLVCYAEIEGLPLSGQTTNSARTETIAKLLQRQGGRNNFHVENVASSAGYYAISVSGDFNFPAGEHIFE